MLGSHDYAEEECSTCERETVGSGIFAGDTFVYICDQCDEETHIYRPTDWE